MAITIGGNPVVGDITITSSEQEVDFLYACDKIILVADTLCQVSINDNTHYKNYTANLIMPIGCDAGINKLFVKGVSGNLGVWGYVK